jgi:hypothetical protein
MKSQLFLSGYISFLLIVLTSCNTQSVPLTDFPENENMLEKAWCASVQTDIHEDPYLIGRVILHSMNKDEIIFDFVNDKNDRLNTYTAKRTDKDNVSYDLFSYLKEPFTELVMMSNDLFVGNLTDTSFGKSTEGSFKLFVTDDCQ